MEVIGMDLDQSCDPIAAEEVSKKKSEGLAPMPVAPGASGEGLPYAPEDWPCPGDKWRWRVGKRISNAGYYVDRFLYPPPRYKSRIPGGKVGYMASKHLVEKFVRQEVPDADLRLFFSSFFWRIPSSRCAHYKDVESFNAPLLYSKVLTGNSECKPIRTDGECKSGNIMCCPQSGANDNYFLVMDCDICCSEDGFCRNCCCILCGGTVDFAYGGYSFIRCEAIVEENIICGHIAHINCALRAYLAGTVRGSIELDLEYYCRRCDRKTDIVSHLKRLLHTCKSIKSRDDVENVLKLGLCILNGSEQTRAKDLRAYIESIIIKLRNNTNFEDVWEPKDGIQTIASGSLLFENDVMMLGTCDWEFHRKPFLVTSEHVVAHGKEWTYSKAPKSVYITADHDNASMKIEDNIDKALADLKKLQESEYRLAEKQLYAQKCLLTSLYQQLDKERLQLANQALSNGDDSDSILSNVQHRVDQIKGEEAKLVQMMQVSRGFSQVPKHILREYFGLGLHDED